MSMRAAELTVDAIIDDLTDRRGLKSEWNQIDEGTREEIRARWIQIIEESVLKAVSWQQMR